MGKWMVARVNEHVVAAAGRVRDKPVVWAESRRT
jgi:hypothetical protein